MFMKFSLYILLICINFSCSGQEKSEDSVMQIYQKQKHHFEFDNYKMLYNQKLIKLEAIANVVKIFGKPNTDYPDLIYYNNPINILPNDLTKTDENGGRIIEYKGKEYSLMDSKGEFIPEVWDIFQNKGGATAKKRDKDGNLLGDVLTYRLWMSPYEITSYIPTKQDSINAKIPALNGYIKINGKLIHQSITKRELKEKLYPLPAGGQLTNMLGDPVLIYDLGKDYKKFDPNMDPEDTRVFIDIVFKTDSKTKEEKGIYYINYYYNLKQKD
jgi:hypothetical protein